MEQAIEQHSGQGSSQKVSIVIKQYGGSNNNPRERNATGMVMTRKDGTTMYSLKIELSLKVVDSEGTVRLTLSLGEFSFLA